MQCQLITGDKQPTNLLKYAKRCQRVYQRLKNLACMTAALEKYAEKYVAATATAAFATSLAKKVSTRITTTKTTSFANLNSRQLSTSEQNQLMKKKMLFM